MARFIDAGHFGAYVRAMRGVYAGRLDVLVRLVRTHLSDHVEPRVPVGGLQMPCLLTGGLPERKVVESARQAGIELLGLTALHASSEQKAGFLMGFAAYTPDEMKAAVEDLANVFKVLKP